MSAVRPFFRMILAASGKKTIVRTCAGVFVWQVDDLTTPSHILGTYELYMQKQLRSHLYSGSVFYDIGSHAGFHCLLGALLVDMGGHVYGFEPHPRNWESITSKLVLNPDLPITCLPYALGETCGAGYLKQPSNSSEAFVSQDGTIEIEIQTIDALVSQGHIRPPSVIKIDVEGFEPYVLRGAAETIERYRPVILIDWDNCNTLNICKDLLEPRGYIVTGEELIVAIHPRSDRTTGVDGSG